MAYPRVNESANQFSIRLNHAESSLLAVFMHDFGPVIAGILDQAAGQQTKKPHY